MSQLYLSGRGDRSYFDVRGIYYYGFSEADSQTQIPVIHPVIDYSYVFGQPVFGGELSYQSQPDEPEPHQRRFRSDLVNGIHRTAPARSASADPAQKIPANCLLRGVPGNYNRVSGEATLEAQLHRSLSDRSGRRS